MRLTWAQVVAGALTIAVGAGLMLLPGRLLGPDLPLHVAAPVLPATSPVQAAPPLAVPHRHRASSAHRPLHARLSAPAAPVLATAVTPHRAVVHVRVSVSPGRRLLQAHRIAVIRQLAPRAPLVRSRQLAAALASPPPVRALAARRVPSLTARTIAALGAGLRKK